MTTNLKTLALGAAVAIGLVSTGALAQQSETPNVAKSQMTHDGAMAGGQMMHIMDAEMRSGMMEMMKNCNQMMDRMQNMSSAKEKRRPLHEKR